MVVVGVIVVVTVVALVVGASVVVDVTVTDEVGKERQEHADDRMLEG